MKFDKKGSNNVVMDNLYSLILVILFLMLIFLLINSNLNNGAFYEDFYAKEISRLINSVEPGIEFKIDVTPLAVSASKSGKPILDIIQIDNVNNSVVTSSRLDTGTSFDFFRDVDVVDFYVESPSGMNDRTRFIFKVVEKRRNEL